MESSDTSDVTTPQNDAAPPAPGQETIKVTKRRPIPRKGHTKSRAGCLVCKRRKVKCDETAPCCEECTRLGLACRYSRPAIAAREEAETHMNAALTVRRPLQDEDSKFSMTDLKSFHNFLFIAYPSLPVDGAHIWQTVGQMSHSYEFLAHSMIALGASHLGMCGGQRFVKDALKHRFKAIKSLNKYWARGCPVKSDADAIFATMLILAFQTGYIGDGMTDHLAMTRGCYIIGHKFIRDSGGSIFNNMRSDIYITKSTKLAISHGSPDTMDPVESEFRESLERIAPKCQTSAETEYVATLQKVAKSILSESEESYRENSYIYEKLGEMTNEQFMLFIGPKNHIARLIIMHMFFLDYEMCLKTIGRSNQVQLEHSRIDNWTLRRDVTIHWIQEVQNGLPEEYKPYGEWVAKRTKHRL